MSQPHWVATDYNDWPPPLVNGTWYLSNSGSDSNSGHTERSAIATVAELKRRNVLSTDVVRFKCGDTFREEVTGLPTGITIRDWGAGRMPIIDGRDIAASGSFTKTGGRTFVYQTSVTHNFGAAALNGENVVHRMWEDGSMMNRAADLASCDATPGTFWAATPTMGPDLVYVHPTGDGSPVSNGKTYHVTTRQWCINLRDHMNHAHVWNIEGVGNAYGTGPFSIDGSIHNCVARDGQTHNVYIRGLCEDTLAIGLEPAGTYGGSTSFVVHADENSSWSDGRDGIFRRCKALPGGTMVAPLGGTNANFNVGFFIHMGNSMNWGRLYFEDCRVEDSALGWGGGQLDSAVTYRCSTANTVANIYEIYCGVDDTGLGGTLVVLGGVYYPFGINTRVLSYNDDFQIPDTIIMRGVREYKTGGGVGGPYDINIAGTAVSITRCTFASNSGGSIPWFQAGSLTFQQNIVYGVNNQVMCRLGRTGAPDPGYVADSNCYWNAGFGGATFQTDDAPPTDYLTLAAWRTATGQEAHSIAQDPQLADPANGNFTVNNATAAALAGAYTNEENDAVLQALLAQYKLTDADL